LNIESLRSTRVQDLLEEEGGGRRRRRRRFISSKLSHGL
jgi:hypothetical protein